MGEAIPHLDTHALILSKVFDLRAIAFRMGSATLFHSRHVSLDRVPEGSLDTNSLSLSTSPIVLSSCFPIVRRVRLTMLLNLNLTATATGEPIAQIVSTNDVLTISLTRLANRSTPRLFSTAW